MSIYSANLGSIPARAAYPPKPLIAELSKSNNLFSIYRVHLLGKGLNIKSALTLSIFNIFE